MERLAPRLRKVTVADVNEHQRRMTNYAIANAQAEAAAQIMSSQDRKCTQSASTRKSYARLQAHWIVSMGVLSSVHQFWRITSL